MTAGNNGASTPEDDDPFGYLYATGRRPEPSRRQGGGGYGYPGSVNRGRVPVGERQYGQPAARPRPARSTASSAPAGRVRPAERALRGARDLPGGGPTAPAAARPRRWRRPWPRPQHQGPADRRGRGGRGGRASASASRCSTATTTRTRRGDAGGSTPPAGQSVEPSDEARRSRPPPGRPSCPKQDAGPAAGAAGRPRRRTSRAPELRGRTTCGPQQPGAAATWTVDGMPEDGQVHPLRRATACPARTPTSRSRSTARPVGSRST